MYDLKRLTRWLNYHVAKASPKYTQRAYLSIVDLKIKAVVFVSPEITNQRTDPGVKTFLQLWGASIEMADPVLWVLAEIKDNRSTDFPTVEALLGSEFDQVPGVYVVSHKHEQAAKMLPESFDEIMTWSANMLWLRTEEAHSDMALVKMHNQVKKVIEENGPVEEITEFNDIGLKMATVKDTFRESFEEEKKQ